MRYPPPMQARCNAAAAIFDNKFDIRRHAAEVWLFHLCNPIRPICLAMNPVENGVNEPSEITTFNAGLYINLNVAPLCGLSGQVAEFTYGQIVLVWANAQGLGGKRPDVIIPTLESDNVASQRSHGVLQKYTTRPTTRNSSTASGPKVSTG